METEKIVALHRVRMLALSTLIAFRRAGPAHLQGDRANYPRQGCNESCTAYSATSTWVTSKIKPFWLASLVVSLVSTGSFANAEDGIRSHSNIAEDERVTVFKSYAHYSDDGKSLAIPVTAWIYEIEPRITQKWALRYLLDKIYDIEIEADEEAFFDRSADLLFADSESGKTLIIDINNEHYTLPATKLNGLTRKELSVPLEDIDLGNDDEIRLEVVLPPDDSRIFSNTVFIEPPGSKVVISDFDDTVKITAAYRKKTLYQSTFTESYQAIDGMAKLYRSWAKNGWTFHFVSSSPEQFYPLIENFLSEKNFPPSVLHLKSFRFTDASVLNLVRSGIETKPGAIAEIVESCMECEFILVGDSGQEDPEVYGQVIEQFGSAIKSVAIHNVSGDRIGDERYSYLLDQLGPENFALFTNPETIDFLGE